MCNCFQCSAVQGRAVYQILPVLVLIVTVASMGEHWHLEFTVQGHTLQTHRRSAKQNMSEQFSNVQNRTTNVEQMSADPVQICAVEYLP